MYNIRLHAVLWFLRSGSTSMHVHNQPICCVENLYLIKVYASVYDMFGEAK